MQAVPAGARHTEHSFMCAETSGGDRSIQTIFAEHPQNFVGRARTHGSDYPSLRSTCPALYARLSLPARLGLQLLQHPPLDL